MADETGRVLAIGRAGGANHQIIGIEAALREIKKASQEAIERSSLTLPLDFAVFGAAGADLPQDFELLAPTLADLGFARRIRVENDTFIALRAGAQKGWGVVVVWGAGCNAAGLAPDGRSFRLPGLGWISGDWGGG